MKRFLALSAALLLLLVSDSAAQVIQQDYDPFTGRTTTVYANYDGSVTIEVVDASGILLFRSIRPGSAYYRPYYAYGPYYGPYYGSFGQQRAHQPTRSRITEPAPQLGIPVPADDFRTVRNPNTGGTVQAHPNPDGTRTVVEVDGRGNVRTYVVPGGR